MQLFCLLKESLSEWSRMTAVLYRTVPYIAACVDVSWNGIFRDRSVSTATSIGIHCDAWEWGWGGGGIDFQVSSKHYNVKIYSNGSNLTFEFFHNSCLIRRIQQNKIYKNLTRNWTQITCLAVRHLNHYTRMFSVLVWGCDWILFMHEWFCQIRLIHLIGQKSLHS